MSEGSRTNSVSNSIVILSIYSSDRW